MDRKTKNEMKKRLSNFMDMDHQRFKDDEIERLNDLVDNRDIYNGQSHRERHSRDGWYSEGKYTRDETTSETFVSDDNGIHVERRWGYVDDDGESDSGGDSLSRARDILENSWFLKKK